MKFTLVLTFLLCAWQFSLAQYQETIASDRPGQAASPLTTGKSALQIQSGFNFGNSIFSITDGVNHFDNATNIRFGILESFELQTTIGFRKDDYEAINIAERSGLSSSNIGARVNLLDGTGKLGSLGVLANVNLDVLSNEFGKNEGGTILILHSIPINDRFSFNTNFGLATGAYDFENTVGIFILNLGVGITDQLGGFIETYGDFGDGDFSNQWDAGLAWLVTKDLQLDVSGGIDSFSGLDAWFLDLGVSWRTKFN